MKTTAITSALVLLACGQATRAQVLSHLTFENQTAGAALTTISENGIEWVPSAAETAVLPVASTEVPPAELRASSAGPTTLAADFSPGFGYLEASGDALTLPDSGWTIEMFVHFNVVGGFQTLLGRDKDPAETRTPNANLYVQKFNDDRFRVEYTIGFEDTDGDGVEERQAVVAATRERPLTSGTWYHLAAVYSDAQDTLSLYVNGQLESQVEATANILPVSDPSTQFWTIGRGSYNDTAGDDFNGQIDDFRITGAALSPSQFLGAASPGTGGCTADIDGDSDSDVQDLLGYLRAFRQGCD